MHFSGDAVDSLIKCMLRAGLSYVNLLSISPLDHNSRSDVYDCRLA